MRMRSRERNALVWGVQYGRSSNDTQQPPNMKVSARDSLCVFEKKIVPVSTLLSDSSGEVDTKAMIALKTPIVCKKGGEKVVYIK